MAHAHAPATPSPGSALVERVDFWINVIGASACSLCRLLHPFVTFTPIQSFFRDAASVADAAKNSPPLIVGEMGGKIALLNLQTSAFYADTVPWMMLMDPATGEYDTIAFQDPGDRFWIKRYQMYGSTLLLHVEQTTYVLCVRACVRATSVFVLTVARTHARGIVTYAFDGTSIEAVGTDLVIPEVKLQLPSADYAFMLGTTM